MDLPKRVERKLLLRVSSLLFLLYYFFAIDRGNIGFAALQMNDSLGLTAEVFGVAAALFTLAYLLFQAPNAELLRRLGASRGFALVACAWGFVSTSTALVTEPLWLLVNRFALGVSEAGFHAFMIYYLSRTFPLRARGFAVGLTFVAVPVSMIVASPLSGYLLTVEVAGLEGWQSLFVIEGVPSVILGLLCLRLIPDSPERMRFLSVAERDWLVRELGGRRRDTGRDSALHNIRSAFANSFVWGLGLVLLTMILAVNVMMIWMPLMIRQVSGAGAMAVGIINSVPWVAFSVGCIVASRMSDTVSNRGTPLRISVAVATVGFLAAAALRDVNVTLAFAAFLVACVGAGGAQGVFWALAMQLVTGPAAAASFAVITVIGSGSGVLVHPLIGRMYDSTGSFSGVVWLLALAYVGAFAILHWIVRGAGPTARAADVG